MINGATETVCTPEGPGLKLLPCNLTALCSKDEVLVEHDSRRSRKPRQFVCGSQNTSCAIERDDFSIERDEHFVLQYGRLILDDRWAVSNLDLACCESAARHKNPIHTSDPVGFLSAGIAPERASAGIEDAPEVAPAVQNEHAVTSRDKHISRSFASSKWYLGLPDSPHANRLQRRWAHDEHRFKFALGRGWGLWRGGRGAGSSQCGRGECANDRCYRGSVEVRSHLSDAV